MRTHSRSAMLLHSVQVINLSIKSRFVAALFVSLCLLGCGRQKPVCFTADEWREGDLVLRCGYGLESKAVSTQSRSLYSHIGLLHYDSLHSEWQVVHAVPAEDEPEYIKVEPVSLFLSPERAQRGAWLRIDCNDEIAKKAAYYALEKVKQQVLFDNDYRLTDSTQIYCTELVWRAYGTQGIDISGGHRHAAPTIFCKEGEAIFPSDIAQSETTLFVKPFN